MGTKRERDGRVLSKKAAKRARVQANLDGNPEEFVGIDDLEWKEVQLPDRLGDVGGFFGLEELEGVEIVRPQATGQVKFKVAASKPTKSILKKTTQPDATSEENTDEWTGFSDGDEGDDGKANPKQQSKSKPKAKPKPEKTKKDAADGAKSMKAKKQQQTSNNKGDKTGDGLQSLPFTALEDEEQDGVDVSAWESLGLSPAVQTGISKLKFSTPSTIQKAVIPEVLAGHDVVGKASTGSGKTLAFGIPILEYYLKTRSRSEDKEKKEKKPSEPIALILSPTRELAHQLAKHIGELNTHTPGANARIALLTGGLAIQKQQRLLADADIVIGTPGRAWEILSSGTGLIQRMSRVKYLVLDEADRLLSDGHYKELEEILDALDRKEDNDEEDETSDSEEDEKDSASARQTLVFSATFHKGLQQKLTGKSKFVSSDLMDKKESMEYLLQKLQFREERPKFIDVNPISQMAQGLKEGILECAAMEKDLYLYTLLLYHPEHRVLVFANSISSVRRLSQLLQNLGIPALALHSSMEQKARLRSVERFSSPDSDPSSVLVATDVAARGLDIKGINMVVHYHVPRTADMYVHRSGRTARAGASGKSVLICAPDEVVGVARLVGKVHAQAEAGISAKRNVLESLELDRRVISRVKRRMALAKKITESNLAKEKLSAEDNWLRNAAEELGVDYDSEEFEKLGGKGRGRGGGRSQKEKQAGSISKAEMAGLRAELKELLSKRINIGTSERYITAGRVDVEALLQGEGNNKTFIGLVDKLEF